MRLNMSLVFIAINMVCRGIVIGCNMRFMLIHIIY